MDFLDVANMAPDPALHGISMSEQPEEVKYNLFANVPEYEEIDEEEYFQVPLEEILFNDPMVSSTAPAIPYTHSGGCSFSYNAEVASARFRLDATLQHLVEKKDDSFWDCTLSPIQSPRKSGKSRKRKRKDDSSDFQSGPQQQTFVMKLFDRSVDLAQFDEASPLYPICRAWIHNQPGNRSLLKQARTPTPDPPAAPMQQGDETFPDTYKLPPPVKDEFSESGNRIPAPMPQVGDMLNIHQDPEQAPPPEQLLLDHMGSS